MNKANIFGEQWVIKEESFEYGKFVFECYNENIGKFYTTERNIVFNCPEDNRYKLIALIHEKTILNLPYFIASNENIEKIKNNHSSYFDGKYKLCTIEECLKDFPSKFIERQERSLMVLYKEFPNYGSQIEVTKIKTYHFFSKSRDDFILIVKAMIDKNWLDAIIVEDDSEDCDFIVEMKISSIGLEEVERSNKGINSKQAFIAMWFDDKMKSVSTTIENTVRHCGFSPCIINKKQYNTQIVPEILLEIEKSHFLIADVTGHRNGVYFEAGYALGNGLPVIFCCKADEFDNSHFDVKQYNHIIWNDENDLFLKLKERILETIVV